MSVHVRDLVRMYQEEGGQVIGSWSEPALNGSSVVSETEHAPPRRVVAATVRQVCALPDPTPEAEVLGSLLVRGHRVVLGAHTGHGKTSLILQMTKAVTERGECLGFAGTGGRALVIYAEQGLRTVKRRIREVHLEESELVDYVRVPDGLSLDSDPGEQAEVAEVLAAGDYSLVALDPHYKLHRTDSNDERAAVDLMRLLDRWREEYQFALLMGVHCRKPPAAGAAFTMHEFFGSGAILRGAEVVLGLQFVRDGYSRLHFFKDRDGDLPVGERWGLLFDRERGFRRDPEDGKKQQTTAEEVRELLEADPGMTVDQLMEATGKADRTVRGVLRTIGAVEKTGGGKTGQLKFWSMPQESSP